MAVLLAPFAAQAASEHDSGDAALQAARTYRGVALVARDGFDGQGAPDEAEVGGAYRTWGSRGTEMVVDDGRLSVLALRPRTSYLLALTRALGADVEVEHTLSVADPADLVGGLYESTRLRLQPDGDHYSTVVVVRPGGEVSLRLDRVVDGRTTVLAKSGRIAVLGPGKSLQVQSRVVGTDTPALLARAWPAGQRRPAWQVAAADTAARAIDDAGGVALSGYLSRKAEETSLELNDLQGWALARPGATGSTSPSARPTPEASSSPSASSTASVSPTSSSRSSTPSASSTASVSPTSSSRSSSTSAPSPSAPSPSAPSTSVSATSAPSTSVSATPSPRSSSTSAPGPSGSPVQTSATPRRATALVSSDFDDFTAAAPMPVGDFRAAMGDPTVAGQSTMARTSLVEVAGRGRVLRQTLSADTFGSAAGITAIPRLSEDVEEASIQYDVRFDADFDWSLGGKLPGLGGALPGVNPSVASGCSAGTGDAWSGRGMWITPASYGSVTGKNEWVGYMYDYAKGEACGDNVRTGEAFTRGTWHTVKQYYKLNTFSTSGSPRADGIHRMWIDGQLVVDDTRAEYRDDPDLHINRIFWHIFRGGHTADWASPRTGTIDIDNLLVTTP